MSANDPEEVLAPPAPSQLADAGIDNAQRAAESAPGKRDEAEAEKPSAAARFRMTRGTRVILIGAVASATASAVITPALFGGLWDAVAGRPSSPQPSVTDSATPRAVELARKSNRSGSISLEVPRGWATTSNSIHNPFGERTPGDAFAAGVDPAGAPSVAVSRIWVAASIDGLERMKAIDPDPEVAAREQLDQVDWQTEGCQLAGITPFPGDALRGSMRKWVGCNGLDDQTFWEAWILTADQRAAVLIQFDIRAFDLDEATALLVLESIVIDPSRLSG